MRSACSTNASVRVPRAAARTRNSGIEASRRAGRPLRTTGCGLSPPPTRTPQPAKADATLHAGTHGGALRAVQESPRRRQPDRRVRAAAQLFCPMRTRPPAVRQRPAAHASCTDPRLPRGPARSPPVVRARPRRHRQTQPPKHHPRPSGIHETIARGLPRPESVERPWTLGFFFREKMRAIHRLAPDQPIQRVLEIGGGQSGLARILYPNTSIINTDLDPKYADAPCNRQPGVQFIPADATALHFEDNTFDLVTMFDLLEHVPDDRAAASEAARVLKPGGYLMVTTPRENWRYPHYKILTPICPDEAVLLEEWGHVRRGYSPADLESLIPLTNRGWAGFISPATSLNHDLSFSRLPSPSGFWPAR